MQQANLPKLNKLVAFFSRLTNIPQGGALAQLVEHLAFNQRVAGSIPARPTIFFALLKLAKIPANSGCEPISIQV